MTVFMNVGLWLEIFCSKVVCGERFSAQRSFVVRDFLLKGRLWLEIFCSKVVCGEKFYAQRSFVDEDFLLIDGYGWRFSAH